MTARTTDALARLPTSPIEMLRTANVAQPASGTNPFGANEVHAYPFRLDAPWTHVYYLFWNNGSAAGGNSSIAVYDADYRVIHQSASTAGASNNGMQVVTVDLNLRAGLYYLALAHDGTTTNRFFRWTLATNGVAAFRLAGCWKQTGITVGALPSTATPVAFTGVSLAVFGMVTRAPINGQIL
jgi:hypothetical protein